MAKVIKTTFKLRRGTSLQWESVNPILAEGEPGYATDINLLKIGDNKTPWKDLPAINDFELSLDGKTIIYDDSGALALEGFNGAENFAVPFKNENNGLDWMTLAPVAATGSINDLIQDEKIIFYGGSASSLSLNDYAFSIGEYYYTLPNLNTTWAEWIDSSYNVHDYGIANDFVYGNIAFEARAVIDPTTNSFVKPDSIIEKYKNYEFSVNCNGIFNQDNIQFKSWRQLQNSKRAIADGAETNGFDYAPVIGVDFTQPEQNSQGEVILNSDKQLLAHSINDLALNTTEDYTLIIPAECNMIGAHACQGIKYIKRICLPAGLNTLKTRAFDFCEALEEFYISKYNQYFTVDNNGILYNKDKTVLIKCPENSKLISFIMPSTVVKIEEGAFERCKNLIDIDLNSVEIIGKNAFANCPNLKTITLSKNLKRVHADAFVNSPNIIYTKELVYDAQILYLGNRENPNLLLVGVKGNLSDLTAYSIPSVTRIIGPEAFQGCYNLSDISFEKDRLNQCITIEDGAFGLLYQLGLKKELHLGPQLRYIGTGAFAGTGFEKVYMYDTLLDNGVYAGISKINDGAFAGCQNLKRVYVPRSIREVGINVFTRCDQLIYNEDRDRNAYYLGSEDPDLKYLILCGTYREGEPVMGDAELRAIDPQAFQEYPPSQINLAGKTLDLNSSTYIDEFTSLGGVGFNYLKVIPKNLCQSNKVLVQVILPNSVEIIEENAFKNCGLLVTMQVGPNIKRIERDAFYGCSNLKIVYLSEPWSIGQQQYKSWFNIEFANVEANPLHSGAELKQRYREKRPNGDYYITVKTYSTLNIGENIETIKSFAFLGCQNLRSINFDNATNLKQIGTGAFYNCSNIKMYGALTIPEKVEIIGDSPFGNCEIQGYNVISPNFNYEDFTLNLYSLNSLETKSNPTEAEWHRCVTTSTTQSYKSSKDGTIKTLILPNLPINLPIPHLNSSIILPLEIEIYRKDDTAPWFETLDRVVIRPRDWDNYYLNLGVLDCWVGPSLGAAGALTNTLLPWIPEQVLQPVVQILSTLTQVIDPIAIHMVDGIGTLEGYGGVAINAIFKKLFLITTDVKELPDNLFSQNPEFKSQVVYYGTQEAWNNLPKGRNNTNYELVACAGFDSQEGWYKWMSDAYGWVQDALTFDTDYPWVQKVGTWLTETGEWAKELLDIF